MASGYGINGGTGRCYPIWLDFSKCMSEAIYPSHCKDFREDYLECLHHHKEAAHVKAVQEEHERQQKEKAAAEKAAKKAARRAAKS